MSCWIITDGRMSLTGQCLGLAEALGVTPEVKRVRPKPLWRSLPAHLWPFPLAAAAAGSDVLTPPWPDILIASGQNVAGFALAVKKRSGGHTLTVQIENPGSSAPRFDLVISPEHDGLQGDNVVTTKGAITRISQPLLTAAAAHFAPRFSHLPRPLVAVLVGGDNRRYRMTTTVAQKLVDDLKTAVKGGAGLLVTASRRTGARAEAVLRQGLDIPECYFWDGSGENPYHGYLALADHIVVTCDSVMMASEAAATGSPVYVVQLEGEGGKFARFHDTLQRAGVSRPFTGHLETWRYAPLNDADAVAAEVRQRLEFKRRAGRVDGAAGNGQGET
ncbi:MAG: mitochondrial fission ELM1 family protein [Leptospirillia bacterium]